MLRRWSTVIGLVVTVVFLVLVFMNVDFRKVGVALRTANYLYVAPDLALTFTGYLLRTARWKVILDPAKRIPFGSVFTVLVIGFAANNLLPARIGELVRAYTLGRKENLSKSLALATIVVERVFDGITLMGLLAAMAVLSTLPGWGQVLAKGGALVFGVAALGLAVLLFQERLTLRLVELVLRPLPKRLSAAGNRIVRYFLQGLHALRSGRSLTGIIVISALVWTCEAASYLMLILGFALPIEGASRIYAAIFALTAINLGNIVPTAPGFVGTFEGFAVLALTTFSSDVSKETAVALAAVAHAYQYVLITGPGLFFLWREGLSLRTVQESVRDEGAEAVRT